MTKKSKESNNQDRKEDARIGYQVAATIWAYEEQLIWSRFNAKLVANSIVLTVIGVVISSQQELPIFTIGMPIAGLILCVFWFLLTKRGFGMYDYWIASTRELEEEHLADTVKTVSRGGKFADGAKIQLLTNGKKKDYPMSWFGRLRVRWVSYLVIALFIVMYIAILI